MVELQQNICYTRASHTGWRTYIRTYILVLYTVIWYQLEGGWKSCQCFDRDALVFLGAKTIIHLQAGTREQCILHASTSWGAPTSFIHPGMALPAADVFLSRELLFGVNALQYPSRRVAMFIASVRWTVLMIKGWSARCVRMQSLPRAHTSGW